MYISKSNPTPTDFLIFENSELENPVKRYFTLFSLYISLISYLHKELNRYEYQNPNTTDFLIFENSELENPVKRFFTLFLRYISLMRYPHKELNKYQICMNIKIPTDFEILAPKLMNSLSLNPMYDALGQINICIRPIYL